MPLYVGFDPTADSLHVGHLVPLLMLRRFQRRRPPADRAGGRGDRHDRRSGRAQRGAQPARRRDAASRNIAAIKAQLARAPRLRARPVPARARRQPRLDRADRRARVPARRRQARDRQLHDGQGVGQDPRGERARHLVHRVQLHAAAGLRLPLAARAPATASCRRAARTSGATSRPASTSSAAAPAPPCTASRCR